MADDLPLENDLLELASPQDINAKQAWRLTNDLVQMTDNVPISGIRRTVYLFQIEIRQSVNRHTVPGLSVIDANGMSNMIAQNDYKGHLTAHRHELVSVRFRVTFDELYVAFDEARPSRTGDNRPRSAKSAVRA